MMWTYTALNVLFMATVALIAVKFWRRPVKQIWWVLLFMIVLTAIFDSVLVSINIFSYDTSKILGVYVISAPIEDFAYAFVAALLIPLVWNMLNDKKDKL